MKNCPQCGNALDDSQQFCTRCGNQLATATPAPASSEPLPPPPPAGAGAPPPPPPPVQLNPTAVPPPPVATPAYSPPSGPMTPPPPPANKSKWWIWLIVALVVIGLIVGLVIWVSVSTRRVLLESNENIKRGISEISISPIPTSTPTTTASPTPTVTPVPQAGPEVVVANFLNSSLGTLPGSRVDYNKAWAYLGDNLKALYPDGSYLPLLLCIQDGPSAVDISEPAFMDMAYINVLANYGGSWINMWEFGLQEKNGLWQIVEISCLSQY